MRKVNKITYSVVNSAFKKANAIINPSEFHGLQAGMICGGASEYDQNHIKIQLDELSCDKVADNLIGLIINSHAKTANLLRGNTFDFNMLLPGNSAPIEDRVKALSDWCRGFLSGLGLAGIVKEKFREKIIKEIVKDLSRIAYIDIQVDDSEAEEKAYNELVDYVKVAIQNVMLEVHKDKTEFYQDNEFVVH